eukprot:TRINITY_DN23877_c0_g1_i1.p1 TRINITY_DN23877_c0_g1~~TRINITY_DN23877_c0_g1_i1.p1  ORF type:complete len:444 (-),score=53.68 TRINITY_DN23877_c0_g1_i1:136-1407(-)
MNWLSNLAKNAAHAIQDEITLTFEDPGCRFLPILATVALTDFPSPERRTWLSAKLNRDYGSDYLVVNLSGQTYSTAPFLGHVLDIVMSGCVPPLEVLLRLVVEAHKWLESARGRVIIIHGGSDAAVDSVGAIGPALVFLAAYSAWIGVRANPKEAIIELCQRLRLNEERAVWPSQRRYLSYFELLQRGLAPSPSGSAGESFVLQRVVLEKIVGDSADRYLEVWQQESCIFLAEIEKLAEGGERREVKIDRPCSGDISVRILRSKQKVGMAPVVPTGKARPVPGLNIRGGDNASKQLEFQVCFNTHFVTSGEFLRYLKSDIDASSGKAPDGCSMDIFFEKKERKDSDEFNLAEEMAAAGGNFVTPRTGGRQAGADVFELDEESDEDLEGVADHTCAKSITGGTQIFVPKDVGAFFRSIRNGGGR